MKQTLWPWLLLISLLMSACEDRPTEPPAVHTSTHKAAGWPCTQALKGAHATYDVGPGQTHEELDRVPWLSLQAGDVVNIHWRAHPYRTKIGLRAQGTASQPVIIHGVTNAQCQHPEISGADAVIAQDAIVQHYFSAGDVNALGTIFINKKYADPAAYKARHLRIQNLKVSGANSRQRFVAEDGKSTPYLKGAAGIYAAVVEHMTVENCELTDNDNGLFVNTREDSEDLVSRHIIVRHNAIHLNGVPDSSTEHNVYVQAAKVLYEGNYIGPLIKGAKGSSLKDRSSGTVIRYNHIVAAARALDLVETEGSHSNVAKEADYHRAWVLGNLIVSDLSSPSMGSVKLIHWGGDNHPEVFRQGPLYFYNNTVVMRGTRQQAPYFTVFDMPTAQQLVQAQNNIFWADGSSKLYLGYQSGTIDLLGRNWISAGWMPGKRGESVIVQTKGLVLEGRSPGLNEEFQPQADSPVLDQSGSSTLQIPSPEHVMSVSVDYQYTPMASTQKRIMMGGGTDLGAFEGN